jgi:hypothetical protein
MKRIAIEIYSRNAGYNFKAFCTLSILGAWEVMLYHLLP